MLEYKVGILESFILNNDIPEEPEESQKIQFTVSHTSAHSH